MSQKNINIIYGVAIAFLLYKQYKRCMCCAKKNTDSLDITEENTSGEMTCEDAVTEVMKSMKFASNSEMEKFKQSELSKCNQTK